MAAALEEGRVDAIEAERLIGFLMMVQHGIFAERTIRRRWARLRELGVPDRTPADDVAWELACMLDREEITAEEAELLAGRFVLAAIAAGNVDVL